MHVLLHRRGNYGRFFAWWDNYSGSSIARNDRGAAYGVACFEETGSIVARIMYEFYAATHSLNCTRRRGEYQ